MAAPLYNIFFTGRDDPRSGCIVIGEDTAPVFYRFETPEVQGDIRTMVSSGDGENIAMFEWSMGIHPGMATIGDRQMPMTHLVMMTGSVSNSRAFSIPDGRMFEWRRSSEDQQAYDLYVQDTRIAIFRRYHQQTPVGPSHAYMQYSFDSHVLLLEALLALCLNRWIDINGL